MLNAPGLGIEFARCVHETIDFSRCEVHATANKRTAAETAAAAAAQRKENIYLRIVRGTPANNANVNHFGVQISARSAAML